MRSNARNDVKGRLRATSEPRSRSVRNRLASFAILVQRRGTIPPGGEKEGKESAAAPYIRNGPLRVIIPRCDE